MEFTFQDAIQELGPNAVFRIANQARPSGAYMFNTILPERSQESYYIEAGEMTIAATMAGLTGMDSPYAPGGQFKTATFLEQSAKLSLTVPFSEAALRTLQQMMMRLQLGGGNTKESMVQEVLNFFSKVIVQGHLDRAEWMRGQVLTTGSLDWTFANKNITVDYGVPSANKIPTATVASSEAYHLASSTFWEDIKAARQALRHNVSTIIMHPTTLDNIIFNENNSIEVLSGENGIWRLRRLVTRGGNTVESSDNREMLTVVTYDYEGELIDPTDTSQTTVVPFLPVGKIVMIGNNRRNEYRVGEGSTDNPRNDLELGFHAIAPTTEGNGQPGRYGRVYTPEAEPWGLKAFGVSNELPVLTAPSKIAILTTENP